jgi:predicted NBD/HSP70 family sugar kinase
MEIFNKAKSGDPKAIELYREFGFHLGQFLKVLILAVDLIFMKYFFKNE